MGPHGRTGIVLLVAATVLTAGCAGLGAEEDAEPSSTTRQRAQITDSMGGVEGVVTSPAIEPIEGANVTLDGTDASATTAEDGSYALSNVKPGTYTLAIRADGFLSTETEIDVRAGEVTTHDTILTQTRTAQAYTQTIELKGFFECGAEVGWNVTGDDGPPGGSFFLGWAACATPNSVLGTLGGGNATNDKFSHTFQIEPPIETLVYEMGWEAENQFAEWMTTRMEVDGFDNDNVGTIFRTQGPSPIHVRLDASTWTELADGFTQQCTEGNDTYCGYSFEADGWPLQTRVFPAWQCASETGGGCVVAQQPFTHVLSAFYNAPAPDGYRVLEAS